MQSLHYRTLHRAFTTRAKLFLYGIIDSPVCPFCEDHDDDFEHALYKCDLASYSWSNFQQWLDGHNIPVKIKVANIVLGVDKEVPFGPLINTLIVLIKRILLSPSETRRALSVQEIDNVVKDQLITEKSQIKCSRRGRAGRLAKFNKRWNYLLHMID